MSATIGPKLLLNATEAAEVMGVEETTIRRLWRDEQLPFVRIGKGRKVTRQWLEDYIAAHMEVAS
ncbi:MULTISPECIES: helix-turn-helix domain-containing protein [unclassified Rhodococcus (in: high G+C Gram-positive bacteria)]|uniref:helix-turn-helix domain-containing protein n=1 Tax=unclassified Rhodococcus (in: high G+C Gram-positive bacteria) TaxID=192944 RepID=UPI00092ACA75|nr:helix-turn-helix domain-containing protein [Rhodococcus sp. M8]OLL21222.1 hypothetical protein BKE56_015540 [Rhodococcus sp. M8]